MVKFLLPKTFIRDRSVISDQQTTTSSPIKNTNENEDKRKI